jgi:hypothetical protein
MCGMPRETKQEIENALKARVVLVVDGTGDGRIGDVDIQGNANAFSFEIAKIHVEERFRAMTQTRLLSPYTDSQRRHFANNI